MMTNDNDIASKSKVTIRILFIFGRITVIIIRIWPISKGSLFGTALILTAFNRDNGDNAYVCVRGQLSKVSERADQQTLELLNSQNQQLNQLFDSCITELQSYIADQVSIFYVNIINMDQSHSSPRTAEF